MVGPGACSTLIGHLRLADNCREALRCDRKCIHWRSFSAREIDIMRFEYRIAAIVRDSHLSR